MKPLIISIALAACSGAHDPSFTQQLCESDGGMSCCPGSPILVDTGGDGIHLTSAKEGVVFELHPGRFGLWAWTEPGTDDAFLALDVNGNGRIEDGAELFGDGSIQVASGAPNGFMALAYYDMKEQGGNSDGVVDARDEVWSRLRLWRDVDHDAFSAPNELVALDAAGVHSFSLTATASTEVDANGNEFRFASTIVADAPIATVVSDVWLQQVPIPTDPAVGRQERDYTQYTCWAWAYATQSNGPDGPNGSNTIACQSPYTASDPIATTYEGRLSKLVARYSTGTVKATAKTRAENIVFNALNALFQDSDGVDHICGSLGFPDPDLYYPPPYDQVTAFPIAIRVKCFSQLIHTGGGGGGGC